MTSRLVAAEQAPETAMAMTVAGGTSATGTNNDVGTNFPLSSGHTGGGIAFGADGLATVLDALDEHLRGKDTLFVVTSPRGYPLGEGARFGPE